VKSLMTNDNDVYTISLKIESNNQKIPKFSTSVKYCHNLSQKKFIKKIGFK
jgi:hypothetical protein